MAIKLGHRKVVKVLLDNNADANIEDGWNIIKPLHIAALKGYRDLVEELIKKDAIINVKSESGETPLHLAVSSGSIEVVKLLISQGAYVNPKNINGRTPLHIALRQRRMEIVKLLDKYGAK
jgi:ankyrin repeat protein